MNARGDDYISLCLMVPISHSAVAMAKKKIPVDVRADDAYLLSMPPWRIKWAPVPLTKEYGNCNSLAVWKENASAPEKFCQNIFKRVHLIHAI